MQWATPAYSWWLLAALPLLGLFLLRIRPRRQSVSSLLFWDQAAPEGRAVSWLHRWRDRLMFLIQLLLLVLMVLALMEPRPTNDVKPIEDVLLIVDNSASMQAKKEGVTRWQQVVNAADSFLAGLPSTARITLQRTALDAEAKWPRGRISPSSARRIIHQWTPSDAPADLETLLRLLPVGNVPSDATTTRRQVVVITDPGTQQRLSVPNEKVRWVLIGESLPNTGITQFQVRRSFADPLSFEIWAEVSHASDQTLETSFEITLGENLLDVVPIRLEPNEVWQRSWTHYSASGGAVVGRLDHDDSLALDNRAFAWLDARPPRKVILVTPGSHYLETVLRAIPWVNLEVRSTLPPDNLVDDETMVIVHRTPIDQLPPGKSLIVDLRDSNSIWNVGDQVVDTLVAHQSNSTWLTHVDLLDQVVSGVRSIELIQPTQRILLESADGIPIYALLEHERGQSLILNVDLDRSDFAWRTAFPLLMVQAIHGLFPQESNFRRSANTGQLVTIPAIHAERPAAAENPSAERTDDPAPWSLLSPSGKRRPLATIDGEWQLGALTEVGFWSIERIAAAKTSGVPRAAANMDSRHEAIAKVACHLANSEESNLQWKSEGDKKFEHEGDVRASAAAGIASLNEHWQILVLLTLIVTMAEWFLYQRRWIGG